MSLGRWVNTASTSSLASEVVRVSVSLNSGPGVVRKFVETGRVPSLSCEASSSSVPRWSRRREDMRKPVRMQSRRNVEMLKKC